MDPRQTYTSAVPQGGVNTGPVNYNLGQPTVVTIVQEGPPIQDHFLWSIFSTLYMNFCCLGFTALVYSVKSRDRKLLGDKFGAMSYSSTARRLNITTTTIAVIWLIIMIILITTGVITFSANLLKSNSQDNNQYNNPYKPYNPYNPYRN